MSILANADASQQMRIRAEELLERKGTGAPRKAGELAGQFAAMLEQLNGVGDSSGSGTELGDVAAAATGTSSTVQHRLGIGAVSVFAQSTADDGSDANAQTPDPRMSNADEAMQVVQSALQSGGASNDFRWLTTLLTQTAPEAPTSSFG
ncbi:hypothetical protein [Azospirillum canadense]|uniref:hypothetical protein n=1 Tax=Azospirillum canadense TaxID=403962 RepID=UPI002227492E|nr:hypothetical protein [Azospirillum canadense]MCW2243478.1 hypothetical protein [Azospirillum canadense]